MSPTYVEPFLGAGAVWLHLVDPSLTPPVSWMGGKRRLARLIIDLLGLRPGSNPSSVLGDASWWGWVWPVVLDSQTGPVVSAWLRSWRGEDPRGLWFRLRDDGPAEDLAERAAGLLWLQARAASGVPVWWDGGTAVKWDRTRKEGRGPANQTHAAEVLVQDRAWKAGQSPVRTLWPATQGHARLLQWASSRVDEAGQTRAKEACGKGYHGKLVAGARSDRPQTSYIAGHKGKDSRGGGGIVDPGTVADRLDSIRSAAGDVTVYHGDALDLVRDYAPRLGKRGRYYLDPPYDGATGYPVECPRDHVLAIAQECARHGGRVVLSEAEPLVSDLGSGWEAIQLRDGRKPEWVTVYRCPGRALLGPMFAEVAP